MNCTKLIEHTYGTHIYMKMLIDGKSEEIDVFIRECEEIYRTSGDSRNDGSRERIIEAFNELY